MKSISDIKKSLEDIPPASDEESDETTYRNSSLGIMEDEVNEQALEHAEQLRLQEQQEQQNKREQNSPSPPTGDKNSLKIERAPEREENRPLQDRPIRIDEKAGPAKTGGKSFLKFVTTNEDDLEPFDPLGDLNTLETPDRRSTKGKEEKPAEGKEAEEEEAEEEEETESRRKRANAYDLGPKVTRPENMQRTGPAIGGSRKKRFASIVEHSGQTLPQEQEVFKQKLLNYFNMTPKKTQERLYAGAGIVAKSIIGSEQEDTPRKREATRLLEELTNKVGEPPWKESKAAIKAGQIKIQLDLLSIPDEKRKVEKMGGPGSAQEVFKLNRMEGDTVGASFVCKPKSVRPVVDGVPVGGDVPREALSSRAAQHLAQLLGLDLDVPETHVFELDQSFLPDCEFAKTNPNVGKIPCSMQEFRPKQGDLKQMTREDKKNIKREQVFGIMVLDTITMNTDRHFENLMIGLDGELIPIDHGSSFISPGKRQGDNAGSSGAERIGGTIGGPHNALLGIPASHDPIPKDKLAKLKKLSSTDIRKQLGKDRDLIRSTSNEVPGEGGQPLISDQALDVSARAARFMKLAAKNVPPLSPAAIQVALGSAAEELFEHDGKTFVLDQRAFEKRAKEVITRAAGSQDVIKDVCLASDEEYAALVTEAKALGWDYTYRGDPAESGAMTDPISLVTIVARKIKRPERNDTERCKDVKEQLAKPGDYREELKFAKQEIAMALIALMPPSAAGPANKALNNASKSVMPLEDLSKVINIFSANAMQYQKLRFAKLREQNNLVGWEDHCLRAEQSGSPQRLAAEITRVMKFRKIAAIADL